MSNVQGRSVDDIRQSHEALKAIWDKAGCKGDYEEWFTEQLVVLPIVEDSDLPVIGHYDADGNWLYNTWR